MKKVFSILAVFIILFAISCGDDDPVKDDGGDNNPDTNTTKETYHDFYPMRVGTEWEYVVNVNGTEAEKYFQKVDSINILGSDTIFYLFLKEQFTKKSDGLYNNRYNSDSFRIIYKYPVNINDEYIYDNYNVVVKNIDTLISVPYGDFKCIEYYFKYLGGYDLTTECYFYISKNIGTIKININYIYGVSDTSSTDVRVLSHYKY